MPVFGERQTTCLLRRQGDCRSIMRNSDMITLSGAEEATDRSAVKGLLNKAKHGEKEPLGQLLQLYRNYLTILATTQLDRKLRQRHEPFGPCAGGDAGRALRLREVPRLDRA